MIQRPHGMGGFEFVVLATLRATQLIRGCLPRIDGGHKSTITAQMEVSAGKVTRLLTPPAVAVLASDILAVTQES